MPRVAFAALFVLALLAAPAARAHDALFPGGVPPAVPGSPADEAGGPKAPGGCPPAVDPVFLDSGAFYLTPAELTTPDLSVAVRGHRIDLRRSYRQTYAYPGPLGSGWDFEMNRRLRQLADGNLLLTTGTCRADLFTANATGWDAPAGVFATLVLNPDGSYTEQFATGLQHRFDPNGSLVEIRDRHGNAIALEYTPEKQPILGVTPFFVDTTPRVVALEYRLLKITDPTGREIDFSYDPSGHIATISDWIGRTWSYGYDARGNLVSVTSPPTADVPLGATTTYGYEDTRFPNAITKIVAPNQQATGVARIRNFYDAQGRVFRQEHGDGGVVLIAYDPPNSRTTITDANGTQKIYVLANRQVVSETVVTRGVRPPAVEPVGTQYTTTHQFTQDLRSRTVFPEGNAIERSFDPNNPDPRARGNLLQMRRLPKPGSSEPPLVTTLTYKTPFNQIGTITDPRGNVTEFFYDAASNLERIQFPAVPEGTPQRLFVINGFGQIEAVTDENGNTVRYVYDANGYLDRITRAFGTPLAGTTEFDPDPAGRPTVLRDANLHATSLVYNAWDLLEASFAPAPFGFVTQLHYDANNNLTQVDRQSELPGNPQTVTFGYTMFDQLASATNELGESVQYGYDLNHNRTIVRDAELNTSTTVFDERNMRYSTADAESRLIRFHYHANGTHAALIDGNGNATTYTSDDFDRTSGVTYADTTTELWSYDSRGNVVRRTTRASEHVDFVHDARNRLRQRSSPTETAAFLYDLGGRMTRAQNSAATIDFGYDARDRLSSEATAIPGLATQSVLHGYDAVGNRTRLTYSDGAFIEYVYDQLNRLQTLRNNSGVDQVAYSYDPLSRITAMLRASGATSSRTYDRASRVKTIVHQGTGGPMESLFYDYDLTGTIIRMTDYNGLHIFGHDQTKQLTAVDYPTASPFPDIAYAYDDAGNRTSTQSSLATVSYSTNALNQYTSVGGVVQSYDDDGNFIGDGTNTYDFDAENRLTSAVAGGTTATYGYDPFMRRTRKAVGGTTTYFLWTGSDLLAEYDGSGVRQVRYIRDGRFAPVQVGYGPGSSEPRYDVHVDHLDTPRLMSDSSLTVSWRANYEAFGALQIDPSSTVALNVAFPGQYFDAEDGTHYNRWRQYEPSTGRYLSADPVGQFGGVNVYAYALNNPLYFFDPLGLLSYLVSRPTTPSFASHNFVVTDAAYIGDPNANIHSFGMNSAGNVGNVGPGTDPDSFSSTTYQSDVDYWQSLGPGNMCPVEPGSNPNVSPISAPDDVVNDLASSLIEDQDYSAISGPFGANSNSAAQAIADTAAGAPVPTPGGPRISPGAGSAGEISFR